MPQYQVNLLNPSLICRTKKNKKKHLAVKSSLNRMNSAPPDNSKSLSIIRTMYILSLVFNAQHEYICSYK